jgi:exodeoxyribonuclease VII large subunit
MQTGFFPREADDTRPVWAVGPLLRAVADALAARFNPVAVRGEISGYTRAASGHCYFTLKDAEGQLRCAMFRRAAEGIAFRPADGMVVEAQGRLDVYGPRGDLQLIVERLQPAGQGALYEQFLRLKAKLEAEGLFDPARKRPLPRFPRSIGVVTSLGAAALRDVVTALRRRVPHVPVTIYPTAVQGVSAPDEIVAALRLAYARHAHGECEVLLLVRGGGSIEDLWSFNDERVVRAVTQAPMPVVCGVGHETDFTLADFAADLRAPTPTAAAELCAPAREEQLAALQWAQQRLHTLARRQLDQHAQRLDYLAQRLGRPSVRLHQGRQRLLALEHRLHAALRLTVERRQAQLQRLAPALDAAVERHLQRQRQRLAQCVTALAHLDPRLVLQRGYAYLTDAQGHAVTHAGQVTRGDALQATLVDGRLDLLVTGLDKAG